MPQSAGQLLLLAPAAGRLLRPGRPAAARPPAPGAAGPGLPRGRAAHHDDVGAARHHPGARRDRRDRAARGGPRECRSAGRPPPSAASSTARRPRLPTPPASERLNPAPARRGPPRSHDRPAPTTGPLLVARPGSPSRRGMYVGRYLAALLAALVVLYAVVLLAGPGSRPLEPTLALDLQGGASVTLLAQPDNGQPASPEQLSTAVDIIRQRVNGAGVSEAEVVAQGQNIVVSVPGGNRASIRNVTQTAQLRFREVLEAAPGSPQAAAPPEILTPPTADEPSAVPGNGTPAPSAAPAPSGAPAPSASTSGRAVPRALTVPQAAASVSPGVQTAVSASPAPEQTPAPAPSGDAGPFGDARAGGRPAGAQRQPRDRRELRGAGLLARGQPARHRLHRRPGRADRRVRRRRDDEVPARRGEGGRHRRRGRHGRARHAGHRRLAGHRELHGRRPGRLHLAHRGDRRQAGRDRARRGRPERPEDQPADRRRGADHRQLQPAQRAGPRQRAPVRRPAADVRRAGGADGLADARQRPAPQRPARRRARPARGRRVLAAVLPRARLRDGRQPARLGGAHLRDDLHPRPADRLRPVARRDRRLHRRGRHHRGLVRRLLRAAQGRDQGGPLPAGGRRPGVGARPPHDPVRRHGVVPRRGHPVLRVRRRRPRLRLHPRPVHAARRRGRLPVHAADGVAALALPVVLAQPARPGSTDRTAASRSRPSRPPPGAPAPLPRRPDMSLARRLYRGETEFPLIRKRRTFYADLDRPRLARAAEHALPGLQPRRGVQGRLDLPVPRQRAHRRAGARGVRGAGRRRRHRPGARAARHRGQGHPRPGRAARAGGGRPAAARDRGGVRHPGRQQHQPVVRRPRLGPAGDEQGAAGPGGCSSSP